MNQRHVSCSGIQRNIGVNVFGLQGAEPALPFGGMGASGMGCHSRFEGFLTYTHNKSVFEGSDDSPLMAALNPTIIASAHREQICERETDRQGGPNWHVSTLVNNLVDRAQCFEGKMFRRESHDRDLEQ